MKNQPFTPSLQRGAYLLEALIGILIFSLGVLGIVGLQAASLRTTTSSSLRAEAVFAANKLLGEMWADNSTDPNYLPNTYSSTVGGPGYVTFKTDLKNAQGGAWYKDPDVVFDATKEPSIPSKYVTITVYWRGPDNSATNPDQHNYTTAGVVGSNCPWLSGQGC
jgi:type IV pilus assembly protein PilV